MTTKRPPKATTTLGDRIAAMMQKRGFSQGELGRKVGMAQQSVNYLLHPRGGGEAKSDRVVDIAIALNADPTWLATGFGLPVRGKEYKAAVITLKQVATFLSQAKDQRALLLGGLLDEVASCDTALGPESFAVRVPDAANFPTIGPGSIMFFDPRVPPAPGDFVVAEVGDAREPVIRRYVPKHATSKGAVFELRPINQDYLSYQSESIKVQLVATCVETHTYAAPR